MPHVPYWANSLGLDPTDFGLFHDFLQNGQRMLHHSSLYRNPIIHHLLPRCQRSMALTAAVLCFQASQVGGVESFAKFDKAMVLYRSMPSAEDITYVLDTGLIICNASMHLGYKWTTLLHRLCCLAEVSLCSHGRSADTDYAKQLEVLASMDFDLWIMGRRTPSRHVWATWCLGGSGIEQITGLPRSLLDLMALSCLGTDISADIRQWITTLMTQDTASARRHIWQACAIATLLHMHTMHFAILSDVDDLTRALKAHVGQFREALLVDRDLNARQALWPLYVVGKSAVDVDTRLYVKMELEGLGLYGDAESKNWIPAILEETWARTNAGERVTTDSVAIEHGVELGIW
ncbi:C6 finger domain protein, partial [Metarhizium hybridum]